MKNSTKAPLAASLTAACMLGLLFQGSLLSSSSAAQKAKTVTLQATNKSNTPRAVQIVLDGATLSLSVPSKAVLLSEGQSVRMSGALTTVYEGHVRISIEEKGKEPVVLQAQKATIKYSPAWFPFNKNS